MSDDLTKKRPQDSSKISLSEKWEIEYWTKALGVSEAKLRELVSKYGNSVTVIRKHV